MPRTLSEPEHITSAIAAAGRALRTGDQACRAEPGRGRIDVVLGDTDRETLAACGAAVLNMQLTLRAQGHAATVDLFPDRTRPELVAAVSIRATCIPSAADGALAGAVTGLHEHDGPLPGNLLPANVRTTLVRAAAREESELVLLDPAAEVGALDRRLTEAGWLTGRPRGGLLAVLNSHSDSVRGQLQAGRALQRVLLTSHVQGAPVVVLLRPEAVQKARPELRVFLGGQVNPQAVLEFGYQPPPLPEQRRRR
ncbi:hypothetical protein [Amycolatopsis pithecellobii]|uniref:Uncharacterized protein n=1 Tax=Amycolatopsis pithecellobii TaxID=664692 RepID=A0A6N7YX17_9PSEU|nr:hypothetical protein [Amycolatopsis pithecellobii]MTD56428.1 hypothetical protein [Amycolatopsis pithecellobii]